MQEFKKQAQQLISVASTLKLESAEDLAHYQDVVEALEGALSAVAVLTVSEE